MKLIPFAVAVATALGAGPAELSAQPAPVYQWTDDTGGVRYTPLLERSPIGRRHTIVRVEPAPRSSDPEAVLPAPQEASGEGGTRATPLVASAAQRVHETPPPRDRAWVVQLGARPAEDVAARPPELELSDGEWLYFVPFQRGGVAWRRLRLGFFRTRGEAQVVRNRLAARFPGAWVVRATDADVEAAKVPALASVARPKAEAAPADPVEPGAPVGPESRQGLRAAALVEPAAGTFAVQLRATRAVEESPLVPLLELEPGERVYRTKVVIDGETWWRLRVGHFATWTAARRALARFDRHFPDAWIAPVHPEELGSAS